MGVVISVLIVAQELSQWFDKHGNYENHMLTLLHSPNSYPVGGI